MPRRVVRILIAVTPPAVIGLGLVVVALPGTVTAAGWGFEPAMLGWTPAVEASHAAIPAWSRKYDFECSECHTAWPKLNEYGRDFKMNGYRIPGEEEAIEDDNQQVSEDLTIERVFPIAGRFIMRPFDKRKDRRSKIRAFHEVEVLFGGRVFDNVSFFGEIEAEDEDDFNLFVESGVIGWHPRSEANVAFGWAPPFWADPFETLADGGRRMTRSHRGPLDLRFAARERLRSASQWVSFFGRAADNRVFYIGGVSSGGDDPEGGDARDGFGRVMVTATPGVYLGGFVLAGTNETQAVDLNFSRAGFDFQIERRGFNVYGMVMNASDDLPDGGDDSWTVGYVEGFYVIEVEPITMIVPLLRLDFLDSFTDTTDLAAVLNFYLRENIKAYFEWWQNLSSPSGVDNDNRATVQIDLVF